MNVQEIINKVKANLDTSSDTRSDIGRIELPQGDPLRRIYKIEGELIRISGDVYLDEKDAPNIKEDVLLQDLVSNYSDKTAPKFEEMDRRVKRDGIEALARYMPFHYETPDQPWGIYLLEKGIWTIVNVLNPLRENNFVTNDLIVFGARILFWHEFFHFLNEIAASTIEITSKFRRKNYHNYREKVYSSNYNLDKFRLGRDFGPSGKGLILEEALANSYCYRQSQKTKGIAACLRPFMRIQPPGYCDFDLFPWTDRFRRGCSILGSLLSDTKGTDMGSPYESLFDIYRKEVKITDVPVYLERSDALGQYGKSAGISLFRPIPAIEWEKANSFKKELKKLAQRSPKKIGYLFENALKLAASSNKLDRSRVNDERIICRKDNLRSFEVTGSIRAFYKTCRDNRQILVGIQEHPEYSEYMKMYKSDHCGERQ